MKKIAWLVPFPAQGSGGQRTVFHYVQALINQGHECHIYIEKAGQAGLNDVKEMIANYFGHTESMVHLGYDINEHYDLIIATIWYTAEVLRALDQSCSKAYFIQDFEPLFYPMGDSCLFAENSYTCGLIPVTMGRWLSHKMMREFSLPSQYIDFCIDTRVYHPEKNIKKERALCFIFQPDKPRRCSLLGIEALRIVRQIQPDVKIYLYGSDIKTQIDMEHENLGLISLQQCNTLYNMCIAGLCISSTNPSRVPFEMMAAGLPVVDIYRENNLYDMPDKGALLALPTPEAIANALLTILNSGLLQKKMSDFGCRFMETRSLEYGYKQFIDAIAMILKGENGSGVAICKTYTADPIAGGISPPFGCIHTWDNVLQQQPAQKNHHGFYRKAVDLWAKVKKA